MTKKTANRVAGVGGLFQWRNSGKGRFVWEEVEDVK